MGIFPGRVIPVTEKLALQWLSCLASGIIGSLLGPVGPVSVYCDWVRLKAWSATSISVWQHVQLSEWIRPWDILACCWDDKQASKQASNQPTNKQTLHTEHLSGLVVRRLPQEQEDWGLNLAFPVTGRIGTVVVILSGTWHYGVSAGTGRLAASLSVGLMEQICSWDTHVSCWDKRQPTKNKWQVLCGLVSICIGDSL